MIIRSTYVNNVNISEATECEGAVSIRVHMPGGVVQTMLLAPGDYIDLMDALEAFNMVTGRRKGN